MSLINKLYNNLIQNILVHSLKLLASGILTSFAFILISSGRLDFIDSKESIRLILFTQYQMIGLTVVKFGMESLFYARFLNDPFEKFNPLRYIYKFGIFVILLFSLFIFWIEKDVLKGIVVFFTLFFDVYSIFTIVQVGARNKYGKVLLLNLLSYPLFFGLFFTFKYFNFFESFSFLYLFLLCAFVRFLVAFKIYKNINVAEVDYDVEYGVGVQQVLNYVLFKGDQIVFSLGTTLVFFYSYTNDELDKYLFLTRFPELISGVLVSLVFLYGANFSIANRNDFFKVISKYKLLLGLYFIALLLLFIIYCFLWKMPQELKMLDVIPYFIVSIAIFFVNMITLGMMKSNKIKLLIYNLFFSIFLSLILQLIMKFCGFVNLVLWITPVQMIIFISLILKVSDENK